MTIDNIVSGATPNGVSYLKMFLTDYAREFNETDLCVSCQGKIVTYHRNWCKKFNKMKNQSDYKLKLKYEGIQLSFGSTIFVTNENITNKIGEQLLKEKGAHLFEQLPQPKPKKNAKVQDEHTGDREE